MVIRSQRDPAEILKLVREGATRIDSRQVIYAVQTMNDVVGRWLRPREISMVLLVVFASLAMALACIGIYGVISYVVGQRTREIGLRMALGAQRGVVVRMVVGEGAKMALAGLSVGMMGAFGLTRLMENQLFGVSAHDPLTFGAVALLLMFVALVACYIPAHRAVRVDPVVALRCE